MCIAYHPGMTIRTTDMDTAAIHRALRELISEGLGAEPGPGGRMELRGVTVAVEIKLDEVVLELPSGGTGDRP